MAKPAPIVAVVYDALTREVTQMIVDAPSQVAKRQNERIVRVPLAYYRTFDSLEDFGRSVSQLAPFYDGSQ
jgi:hypothetical protein